RVLADEAEVGDAGQHRRAAGGRRVAAGTDGDEAGEGGDADEGGDPRLPALQRRGDAGLELAQERLHRGKAPLSRPLEAALQRPSEAPRQAVSDRPRGPAGGLRGAEGRPAQARLVQEIEGSVAEERLVEGDAERE